MQPKINDVVLGGSPAPPSGAMVLGTGKLYGKLFERFNGEAIPCNGLHLRLELTAEVALVRRKKAQPLDDIKIKIFRPYEIHDLNQEKIRRGWWWQFAGYLKHDGALFGHTAQYNPDKCEKELRKIVRQALLVGSGIKQQTANSTLKNYKE